MVILFLSLSKKHSRGVAAIDSYKINLILLDLANKYIFPLSKGVIYKSYL